MARAPTPGLTPRRRQVQFTHADLGTIKGIGGILSSIGEFAGQLDRIDVKGTTTTPDFSVDVSGQPVPLDTTFHAVVDGTNGDTYLQAGRRAVPADEADGRRRSLSAARASRDAPSSSTSR